MKGSRIVLLLSSLVLLVIAVSVLLLFESKHNSAPSSDSESVEASVKYKNNYVYDSGDQDKCLFDIAYINDGTKKPLVLCVHGGYYSSGDKSDMKKYLDELAADGYVSVTINYPLLPEGTIVNQIDNVINAVDYLAEYSEIYEIDKERINVLGFSSGAHLAVCAVEKMVERSSNDFTITSAIDISGPTDYRFLNEMSGGTTEVSPYIIDGNENADILEELKKVDCTDNITEKLPSVLIIHGKKDRTVPYQVSERFYTSLTGIGVKSEIYLIDSMEHQTDTNEVIPLIKEFLSKVCNDDM